MRQTTAGVLGIALLLLAMSPLMVAAAGDETDGKAEFGEQKCVMCHGVAAEELKAKATSDKMRGPDLSGYKAKVEFPELAAFLRGETTLDGKKHRKPFKGTDEELQAIIDWLGSLEAQKPANG